MTFAFADPSPAAKPLHVLRPEDLPPFLGGPGAAWAGWLQATGFEGALGDVRLLPGPDGSIAGAVAGYGSAASRRRLRFGLAKAVAGLPAADWQLAGALDGAERTEAALAWLPMIEIWPEARLHGALDYQRLGGESVSLPFAATLAHVFNHGTHHRGQISAVLTAMGRPAPELDMVVMLREESPG